jgi:hypothetical protein
MYIVGHVITAVCSGVIEPGQICDDGVFALMLPDYLNCHDWGYDNCFARSADALDRLLINTHLLGDWYVHFGADVRERKRVGWAYRRMGVYARLYEEFFTRATHLNLRDEGEYADSVRGFSHTMMEYSVDTFLARRGDFEPFFVPVKTALQRLNKKEGPGSAEWVERTIEQQGIVTEEASLSEIESFRSRVEQSSNAEEFALRAGVKKFRLKNCEESIHFLRTYIDEGLAVITESELLELINNTADFIGTWAVGSA